MSAFDRLRALTDREIGRLADTIARQGYVAVEKSLAESGWSDTDLEHLRVLARTALKAGLR